VAVKDQELLNCYLGEVTMLLICQKRVTAVEEVPGQEDIVSQFAGKKYKPIVLKVRPMLGELPQEFRIVRNITGNLLEGLPDMSVKPPPSKPCRRYMEERIQAMDNAHEEDFLWLEERKLMYYIIRIQNKAFA